MIFVDAGDLAPSAGGLPGAEQYIHTLAPRHDPRRPEDALADGSVRVAAKAPLAELADFGSRLRGLTAGQGTYTLEHSHYDPAPPNVQSELRAAYRPTGDE